MKIYIYTTILFVIGFIILYILIDNKNFRPDTFTGASDTTPGIAGYIPAPKAGQENYLLNGAGIWKPPIYSISSFDISGQNEFEIGGIFKIYVKRITVMINSVNIKSGSIPILQIGSGTTKKDDYFSSRHIPAKIWEVVILKMDGT